MSAFKIRPNQSRAIEYTMGQVLVVMNDKVILEFPHSKTALDCCCSHLQHDTQNSCTRPPYFLKHKSGLFSLLCDSFNPASERVGLLLERGLHLSRSLLVCFSQTYYRHLMSGQGMYKNVTMESVLLDHQVTRV